MEPPQPDTATTPTPTPNVTVSTTCSNVPANWGYPGGLPSGALLATVVWHGVKVGDYVDLGNEPPLAQITSNPFTLTAKALGELAITFTQGSWDWTVWGPDQATEVADGTLTVPACPGQSITPPSAPTPTPTASVQYPPPQITAACWPNPTQYAWTVILSNQPGQDGANGGHAYDFDYSTNQTTWTTFNGSQTDQFDTDRSSGNTLYVRWSADHDSSSSQRARTTPCATVTVTTTCSASNGDGSVTFTGVTVGDELHFEGTDNIPVTANPTIMSGLVAGFYYYQVYMSDGVTEYSGGNFIIALCPGSK